MVVSNLPDNTQIGTISLPALPGWQSVAAVVNLPAGLQTLKVTGLAGTDISLNWIEITKGTSVVLGNWKLTPGFHYIRLTGDSHKKEVVFTSPKSGPVTISLYAPNGRLVARWHATGKAGTVNRIGFPVHSTLPDGVTMMTFDQEGKRVGFNRIVVVK